MRLGLLGGTFDPPHVGHLLAATDALEQLQLDRVLFIPAGAQPFKTRSVIASGEQRVAMLQRMVGDDARFAVESLEIDRQGLSFTVETLRTLRAREPQSALVLLIGEDLAAQFATWKDPEGILAMAEVVVLHRPGITPAPGEERWPLRRIPTRRVDVSSTEIRARVAEGLPVRGFVTEAVADYIRSAALYR